MEGYRSSDGNSKRKWDQQPHPLLQQNPHGTASTSGDRARNLDKLLSFWVTSPVRLLPGLSSFLGSFSTLEDGRERACVPASHLDSSTLA